MQGPSENAVESCGWLAVMADVMTEEEGFVTLQRSSGVQGAGERVAADAQAGLVWTQTAAQVQLAGRQELDAASFAAAQGQHCQTAMLEQELEQELGRLCVAQMLHGLPQHLDHAGGQAQALLLDSAGVLQNRNRRQHWVAWPQLLRNMRA